MYCQLLTNEQTITGILTHEDILSAYKMGIAENTNSYRNISVKRNTFKMLIKGQRLIKAAMKNVND